MGADHAQLARNLFEGLQYWVVAVYGGRRSQLPTAEAGGAGVMGICPTSRAVIFLADPEQTAATQAFGLALTEIGGGLLAGWLIAGAICWQLARSKR